MDQTHVHNATAATPEPASLGDFLMRLFDSDFVPRAHCFMDRPEVIWLHVISDLLITIAYFSIPVSLVFLVLRRRNQEFHWMFFMFAAFIFACGTTHIFSVLAVWEPMYRLDGIVKAVTAALSIWTAFALWRAIPIAVAMPSPTQLQQINERLRLAGEELEERVRERTAELASANASLSSEVTERRAAEHHKTLMMAELDHRVKNNMALVLSLLNRTRDTTDGSDFFETFAGRVRAMAATHEALAQQHWEGLGLNQVIQGTLDPYINANPGRAHLSGPDITLPTRLAQPLCLALHELATNAAKYGAFSTKEGTINVVWEVVGDELRLHWRENAGKPITPPTRRGLGSELIEGIVSYELRGTVSLNYPPQGLTCDLTVPLIGESK